MLKLVGIWSGTLVNRTWHVLMLSCPWPARHAALGRDCQKRLLIALGTFQYFLIRILELCLTWKAR